MVQQPNPVLFYHPDGYRVARKDLKGRHSAGESFLTAFLAQAPGPDVYALCPDEKSFVDFEQAVKATGRPLTAHPVGRSDVAVLSRQALLNLPIPGVAEEARIRRFIGGDAYAVCGITHTISSRQVLDSIADLAVAPVRPWDALICTSRAVHDALSGLLDRVEEDLRVRLDARTFIRPLMPIIPLGVHSARFSRSDADRARWRTNLGIAEDTVVILFFGRLSVHAKASPFQLAQAAELAATRGKQRLAVVWCGWFNDDFQRRVFMNTAKSMAPSVPFHYVDGREDTARFSIWAAADIFCSLSDNIQESFGLTVIEAMAAGLPVVASNWNGYREAIEHNVNGLLVDSYMPAGTLADVAYRYVSGIDTYDLYIGALSQLCVVNLEQTAAALMRLAGDPALRASLAAAGLKTIAERFDWQTVMPRYVELWREQVERLTAARVSGAGSDQGTPALDPAITFAGFPSHRLRGDTLLATGAQFGRWNDLIKQPGIIVNATALSGRGELQALHKLFAGDATHEFKDVLKVFEDQNVAAISRTLHWLIKIGVLRIVQNFKSVSSL
jgi:alpha-maltose-1-phosphate synthase